MYETNLIEMSTCRKVTALYGLVPQGLGTGQVESLHSYLASLAHAHTLAASQLLEKMLPSIMRKDYSGTALLMYWCREAGSKILGTIKLTSEFIESLSEATGRKDLACTALYPLRNFITGEGLFAQVLRHCSDCLEFDVAQGRLPYHRLLWHLSEVRCCPIHCISLVKSACGGSREENLPFGKRKMFPGVCTACGSVAYRCIDKKMELIQAHSGELWKAKRYSELIAQMNLFPSDLQVVKILSINNLNI